MASESTDNDVCVIDQEPKQDGKDAFRAVIDDVRLSVLVASYNVHFAKYSETHSKSTQLIPNLVWKQVSAYFFIIKM